MENLWTARIASDDFRDARLKAQIAALLDTMRRQSSDMFSLEDVRTRLNVHSQHYLGHQAVALESIVGSEGRYADFDRRFLPRSEALRQRWTSIDRAMTASISLPPVDLYKIGDIYFVRDGNHRVSVARQQGSAYIDAFVTELVVNVPLSPTMSLRDLMLAEEYSDFLEWTSLAALRPDQHLSFSELGGYLELIKHINTHRYYMGMQHDRPIERSEAVADWYDNVYMPIVQVIRAQGVLRYFSGRTEADLYRWIIDHRWYTLERTGADPGAETATSEYVERFGKRGLAGLGVALRAVVERLTFAR